jgi:hypothetical protein
MATQSKRPETDVAADVHESWWGRHLDPGASSIEGFDLVCEVAEPMVEEIIAHLAPLTGDAYNGHRETATAAVMSAALAIQRDRYPDRYREMLHGLVLRDSLMEPDRIAIGKTAVEALVAGCVIATVATVLTIWLL